MIMRGSVIVVIKHLIKQLRKTSMIGMENIIVKKASKKCLLQNRGCMMERKIRSSENIIQMRLFKRIVMLI